MGEARLRSLICRNSIFIIQRIFVFWISNQWSSVFSSVFIQYQYYIQFSSAFSIQLSLQATSAFSIIVAPFLMSSTQYSHLQAHEACSHDNLHHIMTHCTQYEQGTFTVHSRLISRLFSPDVCNMSELSRSGMGENVEQQGSLVDRSYKLHSCGLCNCPTWIFSVHCMHTVLRLLIYEYQTCVTKMRPQVSNLN